MSNGIRNNFLHQSFLSAAVVKHQSRSNSLTYSGGNAFFQPQANSLVHKYPISAEFLGNRLTVRKKNKLKMGKHTTVSRPICAVLAVDPSSMVSKKFNLDGKIELQVDVGPPTSNSISEVNIQITSNSGSVILHWGAIKSRKETWILPHRHPVRTMVYKNKALRSPFVKSGANAVLRIEIDDPEIQALEFLVFDESQNIWYKYNGGNFHVKLPKTESRSPVNVSVPKDLVQIQAYLRWERNGKQTYSPEKQKEEYQAARMELLDKIADGSTVEDLRTKLTSKSETSESKKQSLSEAKSSIPYVLVQIQLFIRWEKAG